MKKLLGMLSDSAEVDPSSESNGMLHNLAASIQNRVNRIMIPKHSSDAIFQKYYEKLLNKISVLLISLFSDQVRLALLYGELYTGVKMREFINSTNEWLQSNPSINTQSLNVSMYAKSNGNTYPSSILKLYEFNYHNINTTYNGITSQETHTDKKLSYTKSKDVINQNETIINHLISQLWFSKDSTNAGLFGKVNTQVWAGLKIIFKVVTGHTHTQDSIGTDAAKHINRYTKDLLDSNILSSIVYALYSTSNIAKYIRDLLMIHSDILFHSEKCDGTPVQLPNKEEIAKLLAFAIFNDLRNLFLLSNIEKKEKTLSMGDYENINIYSNHINNMKVFMETTLGEQNVDESYIRKTRFFTLYNLMYSIPELVDKRVVQTSELPPIGYKSQIKGGIKTKKYTRRYLREHRPTSQKHRYTRKFI
jgi:hypothetical protein